MEDEQNGLVGDVEAAPQPINIISQQPQTSSLTISGDVNQFTATPVQNTPQGSYKFVMGPNGQMIAIEKPPFVWKQFLIGGGIPFAIFFIPMVIMMIASGLDMTIMMLQKKCLFTKMKTPQFTVESSLLTRTIICHGVVLHLSLIHI